MKNVHLVDLWLMVVVILLVVSNVYLFQQTTNIQKQLTQDELVLTTHDQYIAAIINTPTIRSMVESYVQSQQVQESVQELPEATTTEND